MIDFFHKGASMTKRISGVARIKGAPDINPRPASGRNQLKIAEISDGDGSVAKILCETVSTPESRQKGLMGRKSLPNVCGMLFEGLSGGGYFWMKDCLIPLDVMFADGDGKITRIYSMPVDKDGEKHYDYDEGDASAIEVNMGFCEKHGIRKGFKVRVREPRKKGAG